MHQNDIDWIPTDIRKHRVDPWATCGLGHPWVWPGSPGWEGTWTLTLWSETGETSQKSGRQRLFCSFVHLSTHSFISINALPGLGSMLNMGKDGMLNSNAVPALVKVTVWRWVHKGGCSASEAGGERIPQGFLIPVHRAEAAQAMCKQKYKQLVVLRSLAWKNKTSR